MTWVSVVFTFHLFFSSNCLVFLEKTKQSCVGKVSKVIREKSLKEKKILRRIKSKPYNLGGRYKYTVVSTCTHLSSIEIQQSWVGG